MEEQSGQGLLVPELTVDLTQDAMSVYVPQGHNEGVGSVGPLGASEHLSIDGEMPELLASQDDGHQLWVQEGSQPQEGVIARPRERVSGERCGEHPQLEKVCVTEVSQPAGDGEDREAARQDPHQESLLDEVKRVGPKAGASGVQVAYREACVCNDVGLVHCGDVL